MMIRWYTENPIDGKKIARAIKVGIPPDEDCNNHEEGDDVQEMHVGFTVPEADREVIRTSVKRLKDEAVAALPLEGESHQVKVDLKYSSPKKLPKDKLLAKLHDYMNNSSDRRSSNAEKK